jgi:hypothetical protein
MAAGGRRNRAALSLVTFKVDMRILAAALAIGLSIIAPLPGAQSTDLDRLMERVLTRRDDNWKKLQQYVLDEKETFDLTGPGGARLFGFRRDFTWFMREGVFVRSPLRVNGVSLSEDERRKAETTWIRRERRRDERRKQRAATASAPTNPANPENPENLANPANPENLATPPNPEIPADAFASIEPRFVSWAYFLEFKFEPNHYGLVGRETLDGRPVLRIEYYPEELFHEGRTRPNRKVRERDEEVEEKMNKVSLITLWVDPDALQILQYTFDDIDMGFLPGRSIARVDDVKATMRMTQPFPGVWLPRDIEMRFRMSLASGAFDARYAVQYHDYRQADVTYKVR